MNEHVRNNRYFATAKEFRIKIDEFFIQTLPNIGDILASRINDNVTPAAVGQLVKTLANVVRHTVVASNELS